MMKKVMSVYLSVSMFLFPILMFPMVVDPFGFGKNWLIMALAVVGILLWVAQILAEKTTEVKTNKMLLLLGLMTLWAWAGWWFRLSVGERMRSFTDIGGVGTMTAAFVWFFLWLQSTSEEERRKQLNWLTASGILVMVTSLIVFLFPASKLPIVWPKNNPILSITTDWSLTGSLLAEGFLMLFLVLEWGKRLMAKLKEANGANYILEAVFTSGLTLALLLDIFRIIKTGWVSLDGATAWVIAVETFKRSPIWGAGIGNFITAFSAFRPTTYNLTQFWASGFRFSSMGVLQLWTELGAVGMLIGALMVSGVVKMKKNYNFAILAIVGLLVAFLPFNVMGVWLLLWLIAASFERESKAGLVLKIGEDGFNVAPWLLSLVIVGVSIFGSYWMYRVLLGDIFMRQSLVAASKNDGGGTYNLQIKAIGMNPNSAEYRKTYSQTNLALTSALLSNKDLTDDDKQKASTLIQQAVREGKAAITLEGNNPNYWLNLADIYRKMVGVVDGSADWSFQAYQQAVALEPANPMSKLEMGGLLFAANRFDEADRVFEQVVTAKPDFANGWYNWAYTAKNNGRLADAVSRMTQALTLVPADSGDYDKASKELADWKKQLDEAIKKQNDAAAQQAAAAAQKQPETLKTESPLPTGNPKEKVAVPSGELAPPKVQITPTITPTPSVPSGN